MADTRRVLITYNPDLTKVGKEFDVDPETAKILVDEGRARYVDVPDEPPVRAAEPAGEPAEAPAKPVKKTTEK